MASIIFFGGSALDTNLNGSGLGFYGSAGFGTSVEVAAYQDGTFITNSAGTTQSVQCNNIKRTHPSSGNPNGAGNVALTSIANALAPLKIRFNHSSAVRTQNAKLRIFDRSSINNNPSGVTALIAELIHPNPTNGVGGSGDATWVSVYGSGSILDMAASPGLSGYSPNGASTQDMNADWYAAISCSPDSIGAKTFALYFECEYL